MSTKTPFAALYFAGSLLSAETHRISPDRYYTTFSAAHSPIAHIRPGDTVITKCLDSRGRDESGKLILDDDNVLTGPFYVEGAEAGDTLVVKLDRVRLNRDWGWNGVRITTDALAPETIEGLFPANCCDAWLQPGRRNALRWNLDRTRGTVAASRPLGERVKLEFSAHPSLGCVGVAPPNKQAIDSGPMGAYGGNMDYNAMDDVLANGRGRIHRPLRHRRFQLPRPRRRRGTTSGFHPREERSEASRPIRPFHR